MAADEAARDVGGSSALATGRGRAFTAPVAPDRLLDACLHDLRFDAQADALRARWLWELLGRAAQRGAARAPIAAAVARDDVPGDIAQLCRLAYHYAAAGDASLRVRIAELACTKPYPTMPWLGEEEHLALAGVAGLVELAAARAGDPDAAALVDTAIERLGEAAVTRALAAEPGLAALAEAWRAAASRARAPAPRAITLAEIIDAAERGPAVGFRRWGMDAPAAALEAIVARLQAATAPVVIARYLRVFAARPLPAFAPAILALCRHADAEVRWRAIVACSRTTHPAVRDLALADLRRGDPSSLALFAHNLGPGDAALLAGLPPAPDPHVRHGVVRDLLDVVEHQPAAPPALALAIYAQSPCATCRGAVVGLLHARAALPPAIREECRYDAQPDTRALVDGLILDG